jgi:malonyl-CoA O-methyltransferase
MPTTLTPRAAYELWADSYPPEPHNPLMTIEQSIVSRLLGRLAARRALDVGTGSGRYLPLLAARAARVVGLDLSMAMLARGRGGSRVQGDACRLPFPAQTFDLVNASLMAGDIADLSSWIGELARVARPGCHFIYSDFHPSWTERGWQRTFRSPDGSPHVVQFVPHTIDAHLSALDAGRFHVRAIHEPRLTVRGEDIPVVVIFYAVQRGASR